MKELIECWNCGKTYDFRENEVCPECICHPDEQYAERTQFDMETGDGRKKITIVDIGDGSVSEAIAKLDKMFDVTVITPTEALESGLALMPDISSLKLEPRVAIEPPFVPMTRAQRRAKQRKHNK